jgi:hypothetical protein
MSYDISFWRESRPVGLSPNEAYRRLSRGKPVEGLAELPVEEVFAGLREAFGPFYEELSEFETDDCSIEVSWSACHFRFDLRGDVDEAAGRLVALMAGFGCSPYDPQVDTRGAAEEDAESTPSLPKAITDLMASRAKAGAEGTSGDGMTLLIERPDDDGPATICVGPSDSDIEPVVKSLPWDDPLTLRLWWDDSQHFEVYGSLKASIPDDKLRAYYQEGDTFYASKKVLKTTDEVARALASYNRGDAQWWKDARWKVLRKGWNRAAGVIR